MFMYACALAHVVHHALVNEIHDKYSMHAKIIVSCLVAQRYHGVFLVFEFDRFFSEATICFFSGPRAFQNQPPKRSSKFGIAALRVSKGPKPQHTVDRGGLLAPLLASVQYPTPPQHYADRRTLPPYTENRNSLDY